MPSSHSQLIPFLSQVLACETVKVLGHIAKDTIAVIGLLGALSIVHFCFEHSGLRAAFLDLFASIHECVVLGMYLLLAGKSFLRMAKF